MTTQNEKAETFAKLHVKGDPLILFNIWDAGSAVAVAAAGAKAIATGSWGVAAAFGFADGEKFPIERALDNAARIVEAVDVPVTLDLEGGYAGGGTELSDNIKRAVDTGVVGINFEDQVVGSSGLYSTEEQVERIRICRAAAESAGVSFFINARTDLFLKNFDGYGRPELDAAIERAKAYADAGADGFFAAGLRKPEYIRELTEASPLPVNILAVADAPPKKELAALGVGRISYGARPYREMMAHLTAEAAKAFA